MRKQTKIHDETEIAGHIVQFGEHDELLDIRYDSVFKAVFARDTPASRGALSALVSALIGQTISVDAITANEPPADHSHDRSIRFDIACKTETGELINIEMSLFPNIDELNRLEYYAAKLFTGQNIQGKNKTYSQLRAAYQIAILGRKCFFDDKALVHNFQYYDSVHDVPLNGKTRIITLELRKAGQVIEKPVSEMETQEAWAAFFEYLTTREKRTKTNEILRREEGIAMAGKTLITITQEEREYARSITRLKNELDYQSGMINARREGERKKAAEIARSLKVLKISPDVIAQSTGLTPEEITRL